MMIGFIHIPKNAGQSARHWFKQNKIPFYSLGHLLFSEIDTNKADWWFAISRNPFDRIISFYEFSYKKSIKKLIKQGTSNRELYQNSVDLYRTGFESWLFEYHKINPQMLYTQKSFIERADRKIDSVIKLENIKNDWKIIQEKTQNSAEFPLSNTTLKSKNSYYNDNTQEYIYNHFKEDFDLFGYSSELKGSIVQPGSA